MVFAIKPTPLPPPIAALVISALIIYNNKFKKET